jgi:hypothetical protein
MPDDLDSARRRAAEDHLRDCCDRLQAAGKGESQSTVITAGDGFGLVGNHLAGRWLAWGQVEAELKQLSDSAHEKEARWMVRKGERNGPPDNPPWLDTDTWNAVKDATPGTWKPTARPQRRPVRPLPPPPTYPPEQEVDDLLGQCCARVDADDELHNMLLKRRLDSVLVSDLGLAAALPVDATVPSWARRARGPWSETGHRLLLPLWDQRGELRSFMAIGVGPDGKWQKWAATGVALTHLVLANSIARHILQTGELPPGAKPEVWVVEGEPDFLTMATEPALSAKPVLGIFNGGGLCSRPPCPVAARFPAGLRWVIATDNNSAGDGYSDRIQANVAALAGRVDRAAAPPGPDGKVRDWNDLLRAGELRL